MFPSLPTSEYPKIEIVNSRYSMTLTINLKPETEAGLAAQARARGVSVAEYVGTLLEQLTESGPQMTPEQRAVALSEWAKEFPRTAPLSD
jgi:hypothetical protein